MQNIIRCISLIFISFTLFGCDSGSTQQAPPPLPVHVAKVASSEMPVTLSYIGVTKSIADITITARIEGFLKKKNFTEGKFVEKGSLLYVIDPRPFQVAVDLSQANLDSARADSNYQLLELKRYAELVKKNFVSQEDYNNQQALYKESIASVEVAQANLETAKINLGYCYMYSPVDGIASVRNYDVGNLVGTTDKTDLMTVVTLDPMFVYFAPSTDDFSMILKYYDNMPFKVVATIPKFPDISFTGQVDMINNQANVDTSTIQMRALIKNPKKNLRPNIYVNVTMTLSPSVKVIQVPSSATFNIQGSTYIYLVDSKNKVESKQIMVSTRGADKLVVESGLKIGDTIVLDNLQKLRSGTTIKPISTKATS